MYGDKDLPRMAQVLKGGMHLLEGSCPRFKCTSMWPGRHEKFGLVGARLVEHAAVMAVVRMFH